MAWGLLQGFGRGLSQGAEFLSRGMQEDRAVERERLREESIAKRWARQEAREDARYADEKKYRDDRNKVEDKRYNEQKSAQASAAQQAQSNWQKSYSLQERQLSASEEARRAARIEETLNRIQSKYSREGEQIDRRYERLLDKAEPEEKEALHKQRDREHEALGIKLNSEMLPALKSFGDGLKGTAYATYIDEIANMESDAENSKGRKFLQDAGVLDAGGQFVSAPAAVNKFDRAGAAGAALSGHTPADGKPKSVQPGLLNPGFVSGFNGGTTDFSNASRLERGLHTAGAASSLAVDAGRATNPLSAQGLLSIGADYLTAKPATGYTNPALLWAQGALDGRVSYQDGKIILQPKKN